jgi:hypothetical protein
MVLKTFDIETARTELSALAIETEGFDFALGNQIRSLSTELLQSEIVALPST